jgi:hypothetical protein
VTSVRLFFKLKGCAAMEETTIPHGKMSSTWTPAFLRGLNGPWHKRAMQIFLVLILAHWAEHLLQAYQVYALGWPRHHSHGALGLLFPWLDRSEWLHYGYALLMLVGLVLLRPAFVGRARFWWNVALIIQIWHFVEHALLLGQAMLDRNLFGLSVPTSLLQLMLPRVELHLFYNAIVFLPMLIAMRYHLFPSPQENRRAVCACSLSRPSSSSMRG